MASQLHEPLFIGIALPFIRCRPWTLQGTPLLVELVWQLRKIGTGDGGIVLCKLLGTLHRLGAMSDVLAHKVLRVYGEGAVSNEDAPRCAREPMVQAEDEGR
jgi:hypothetical protein